MINEEELPCPCCEAYAAKLRVRVKTLEDAIKYYATPRRYKIRSSAHPSTVREVTIDDSEVARKALEGK
jgi:hypothetical protein